MPLGEQFTHAGHSYQRMNSRSDQRHHDDPQFPSVRVRDQQTGEVRSLSDDEEAAFWEWAYVEILRHTGLRVEELVELAHTSIRQYRRPKRRDHRAAGHRPVEDRSGAGHSHVGQLFHVIAMIVLRQTSHGPIPLIPRYDGHERVRTAPMPYLFQRQIGGVCKVTSPGDHPEQAAEAVPDARGDEPGIPWVAFHAARFPEAICDGSG
jgi:hypothetical protein